MSAVTPQSRTSWSAIVRKLFDHPENKCSEKGHGENGANNICRCRGRVSNCLPVPNERDSTRHNCQGKTNNHNCAENNDYVLARYKLQKRAEVFIKQQKNRAA